MNAAPATDTGERRNKSLDLLRGLAILMVVLSHCELFAARVPGLTAVIDLVAESGVQLFFIVSGYTMMLTFGDRIDPAAAAAFYVRRIFRIVPLFWLAIAGYLAITRGEGFREWTINGITSSDVLLNFLFLQWSNVTSFNSVVPGGWSIAVEMQFYLLFPLIIFLFRRKDGPLLTYALIALVSVVANMAADHYLIPRMTEALPQGSRHLARAFFFCWLPHQLVCFGFGILLYDYIERGKWPAVGALLLVASCLTADGGGQFTVMFLVAFVVLALRAKLPIIGLFGRHSYAIYLVHFALLFMQPAFGPFNLLALFGLVAGFSLALSYFVIEPMIERPFNQLGHAIAARLARKQILPGVAL